jgi:uncharacterized membrane protein YkoI
MRTPIIATLALLTLSGGQLQAQQMAPPEAIAPARIISSDSARAIALRRVPGNDGIRSEKLTRKGGVQQYEIGVELPGAGHQKLSIDAHTGAVLSNRYTDDFLGKIGFKLFKAKDKRAYRMDFSYDSLKTLKEVVKTEVATVSEDKARAIALRHIPNGILREVYLDRNDEDLIWRVTVDKPGAGSQELFIDAHSGEVLPRARR